ncbi:MAG TPA: M1 family aminopeptidase, partial [candidate division Zixibacteria bacterium]|nr:M1 family aminopeptidase [candidate division Zixibacteria bacterium]
IFSSGEESGPIALGWRTSSTKTLDDYGLIIYKKGALVLHMLRNLLIDLKTMNEDLFFEMMKEYYATFKGKDATTEDFKKLTELYTGIEMDWFFNQWVYGTELPEYEFKYVLEKADDGYYYANCTITQSNVSADFKMYVPVEIEFPTGKAYIRLLIDKPVFEVKLPPLAEKPKKIRLNSFESVLAKVNQ